MFQNMQYAWNEMFIELDRKAEGKGYSRTITNIGKVVAGAVFVALFPFGFVMDLVLRGIAVVRPE